jgi:hypothetical protein
MRVLGANDVVSRDVVEFVATESVDHSRRDADRAEHHGHGRGEIFAMSLLTYEKKISNRIAHGSTRQFERVSEAGAEVALDGGGLVEIVGG